jgi:methanogenic corrinoid protein MtbC1
MLGGVSPLVDSPLGAHLDAFRDALLARDRTAARATIERALLTGASIEDVYLGILQPALYEIGDLWAAERVTVADEHFASAVVATLVMELGPRIEAAPRGGRLAVLACTPGELHDIGLLMVRDLLRAEAWEVLYLGASTPAPDLAALVADEQPDAVVLSTSTAGRLPGIEETLGALAAAQPSPIVVVGGQFWTAEAAAGASAMGADLVIRDARLLAPRLDKHVRGWG